MANPGRFAYRNDTLKPNISERLVLTSVSSLTGEPDFQHVRRATGVAPFLFQFPQSRLPLGLITSALLDAWILLLTPCVR